MSAKRGAVITAPSGDAERLGASRGQVRPHGALDAAIDVLAALRREQVRYCHWKSVWGIERSLAGDADLDLLIDRRQCRYAQEVFARCGFKRFMATEATGYAAVEDYVGLDAAAGRLVHCHVHYRLILGEPNLKSYRLPWEKLLLDTRRLDAATNVFVAESNLEMVLLFVRFSAKLRWRDIVAHFFGRDWVNLMVPEYQWIRDRIDPDKCVALCRDLLGEPAAVTLREMLVGPITLKTILRFKSHAGRRLHLFRRYGFWARSLLRWRRELASVRGAIGQRQLSARRPQRRSVPTGGLLITFLGSDGSGKSTLAHDVATLFAGKLDVLLLYFGSGSGPSSWLRWPLNALRAIAAYVRLLPTGQGLPAELNGNGHGNGKSGKHAQRRGVMFTLSLIVWALVLAREKRLKLLDAWRARDSGVIVLADRYPQSQIAGFNDGPLLSQFLRHRNWLLRWIARHEARPYHWAEEYPPDIVIKLNVSAETALQRKPDMKLRQIVRRIKAVQDLSYPFPVSVAEIDANRPLATVRADVCRAVWDNI
jgi:thymidylate kinase